MADIIQIRRDTAGQWTTINPTLAQGEFGWELDAKQMKIGDGATPWNSLAYVWGNVVTLAIRIVIAADSYYDIPQYWMLENFVVEPTSDLAGFKAGSTAGGEEYIPAFPVLAAEGQVYVINKFAKTTTRVYLYGITSSTTIVLFIKYIRRT